MMYGDLQGCNGSPIARPVVRIYNIYPLSLLDGVEGKKALLSMNDHAAERGVECTRVLFRILIHLGPYLLGHLSSISSWPCSFDWRMCFTVDCRMVLTISSMFCRLACGSSSSKLFLFLSSSFSKPSHRLDRLGSGIHCPRL